jgi:hypothetical protein
MKMRFSYIKNLIYKNSRINDKFLRIKKCLKNGKT